MTRRSARALEGPFWGAVDWILERLIDDLFRQRGAK
jgi:hypothetical protein